MSLPLCAICKKPVKRKDKKYCSRACFAESMKGPNNHFFGQTHSDETKKKISKSRDGIRLSEEHKAKISKTQKGIPKGPMKIKTKEKLSKIKKEYFKSHDVWNKGETKETNDSIKSVAEKLSFHASQRIGPKNSFFGMKHSKETKKKQREAKLGMYDGSKNPFAGRTHTESVKKFLSKLAVERAKDPEVKKRLIAQGIKTVIQQNRRTKIELLVENALYAEGVDFVSQYKFRNKLGMFVCVADIAFPDKKKIVELHGDFYHVNPAIYKNKKLSDTQEHNIKNDGKKAKYYAEKGWDLLIVWESDIKNDLDSVIGRIIDFIS